MFRSRTSEWAPEPGETLRVYRFTGNRWRATSLWLPPFEGPEHPSEAIYQAFLAKVLPELVCPRCGTDLYLPDPAEVRHPGVE